LRAFADALRSLRLFSSPIQENGTAKSSKVSQRTAKTIGNLKVVLNCLTIFFGGWDENRC
jgi:hypothetical protein